MTNTELQIRKIITELSRDNYQLLYKIRGEINAIMADEGKYHSEYQKKFIQDIETYRINREQIDELCRRCDLIHAIEEENAAS